MTNADMEVLMKETKAAIIALEVIRCGRIFDFGDCYKHVGINFSIKACECAAEITGYDKTFCKMMNHQFRAKAAALVFEKARD